MDRTQVVPAASASSATDLTHPFLGCRGEACGALTDLPRPARQRFLLDMSLIGEAIEEVCRPDGLIRVNYEILGNTDPYLHAHIFPRYRWEPPGLNSMPVWHYPADRWRDRAHAYSLDRHADLRHRLTAAITGILATPS